MITLVILHQPKEHGPVPKDVEVLQTFGPECVRYVEDDKQEIADGYSVLIRCEQSALYGWLNKHSFWYTSNPMLGNWKQAPAGSLKATSDGEPVS